MLFTAASIFSNLDVDRVMSNLITSDRFLLSRTPATVDEDQLLVVCGHPFTRNTPFFWALKENKVVLASLT